ncbi:SAM-dependent methyltransferase [Winogradskyella litorisediminis]|uniref:SAM-dependent methyltransferase n=1 Tax=Winogradskyella litorisediminis TaxID=1156618 RepID=A0ABW3N999_9FLAO
MKNKPKIILDSRYWESRYQDNSTGWDLGKASRPLEYYIEQLSDKDLKILIPGGGNSYEAEYLIKRGFKNTFVVDLSKTALMNLKNRVPDFPSSQLLQKDFFDINMKFDLILEQTFFCAINPSLRNNYAEKISELLTDNGKLVGLLFNVPLYQEHPPFGGNKNEYEKYFEPYFNIEIMELCYNSESERKGKELFMKLQKKIKR